MNDVERFARAILHGDDVHRAWLLEAAERFVAGEPVPPPTKPSPDFRARIERATPHAEKALKRLDQGWRPNTGTVMRMLEAVLGLEDEDL